MLSELNNNEFVMNKLKIDEIQDYMFNSKNLTRYTKHMINNPNTINNSSLNNNKNKYINKELNKEYKEKQVSDKKISSEKFYMPKQKDSLFWCFYILKHGYFNYEMEINNQYFVVEKNEKFKYIDMLRHNKDKIKLHKIKPFTELENDLANKDKISIKTFFALCILENINVLLIDKRKIYEVLCVDIDNNHPINIVHRNNITSEHNIELNVTDDVVNNYKNTYYKMNSFDSSLKAMSSYKLEELLDLCKKLDINTEIMKSNEKKKKTKKDIYELLVLNY
jgi:hypothetical protein